MAKKIDKLLEQSKAHLDPGEQVLAAILGTYATKIMGSDSVRTGILLATRTRVVFFAKKMGGYDLESIAYGNISSFEQAKSVMGHSVAFFASGNQVTMKWISDKAAMQTFVSTVKEHLHVGPAGQLEASAPSSKTVEQDLMGKIRQLGELHQAGILSDEEFASKKAELLSRI